MKKKDPIFEDVFLEPALLAYQKSEPKRESKKISDIDFLVMGIKRIISNCPSGRGFVQTMIDRFDFLTLTTRNFFKSIASPRRLKLMKEINDNIIDGYAPLESGDPFRDIPELDGYALYAADGHYHEHASHERHENGKAYSVGHLFATNLRTRSIRHLDVLRPGDKMENETHALKRLGSKVLRMGEPAGRKVIMVYDRACVDFMEWHKWKQGRGLYVVTREKSNMRLQPLGNLEFDRDNPINANIVSDQQVGHSHGRMIRRIVYTDPVSGKTYAFITNVFDLPPGIIAYLYKVRWDIEKAFQEFKSKYNERKAWGKSAEAKSMQANFLCVFYNLLLVLEDKVEVEEGIVDRKVIEKQKKRIREIKKKLREKNLRINPMIISTKKGAMRSAQFIRLVEIVFNNLTSWSVFIMKLRPRMEVYL